MVKDSSEKDFEEEDAPKSESGIDDQGVQTDSDTIAPRHRSQGGVGLDAEEERA